MTTPLQDRPVGERVLAKLEMCDHPVFTPAELLYLTIAWREKVERDRQKPGLSAGLMYWVGFGVGIWIGVGVAAALILLA